jgi:hypothetical protein
MLRSRDFCNEVLNWATGILEIDGIYLIPHITQRPSKQIGDPDLLLALFSFVDTIRSNDMDIILGYLNTEGIPLLVTEPTGITMGSYENLRMFRLTAFKEKKPQQMRGPIPRIYIPKLLQWVDHRYMDSILRYIDEPEDFLGTTEYKELMFTPEYNWHFQKSEPYKHYFVGFSEQVSSLTNSTGRSRFEGVRDLCFSALDRFDELKQNGVVFDSDSGSSHIPLWLNVLNVYGRERGFIP